MAFKQTVGEAWKRFRRLWKPMACWTAITWLLIASILVPFSSAVLRRITFRGDRLMIGHEDIVAWLLTPAGAGYLLAVAGLAVLGAVFRYAGLFHLLRGDLNREPVSVYRMLVNILPDIPAQFRICVLSAGAAVLLTLPFLCGLLMIHRVWLGDHDINFYLAVRPRALYHALACAGLLVLAWGGAAGYLALRCVPVLPAFLEGRRPLRKALRQGWAISRGRVKHLLGLLLVALGGWWAVRFLTQGFLTLAAAAVVGLLLDSLPAMTPALMVAAGHALLTLILGITVSFLGFSFTSLVLSLFYYRETGLHPGTVPAAPSGRRGLPKHMLRAAAGWLRPQRSVPLIALLFVAGAIFGGQLLTLVPEPITFTVTAHRAGAFLAPENTLAALERAIDVGAEYAEIDVQLTADNVIVVVHDADLMRVAGDPRRVSDARYPDIAGLVQGDSPEIPEDERRIATLDEFLSRSRGRIKLNIELKYYRSCPLLAERVVELVRARGMEEQVVMMSLSLAAVRELRRLAPDIRTGVVTPVSIGDPARLAVDFFAVPLSVAGERFIRRVQHHGREVHVWTLNTPSEMLAAAQRGADGIITDAPDTALRLRRALAGLSRHERLLLSIRPRVPLPDNRNPEG